MAQREVRRQRSFLIEYKLVENRVKKVKRRISASMKQFQSRRKKYKMMTPRNVWRRGIYKLKINLRENLNIRSQKKVNQCNPIRKSNPCIISI